MKLPSAPRCIRDGCDVLLNASIAEFPIEPVDVCHDEAIGGSVAGPLPLFGIVPLKVEFHTVSPDGRIVRVLRGPTERPAETQLLIELDRRGQIPRHKNRVDGINAGSHGLLAVSLANMY